MSETVELTAPDGAKIATPIRPESLSMPDAMPRVLAIAEDANKSLASVRDYMIDSPELYECAGEDLRAIKAKQKALDELRDHLLTPLNQHVKRMREFFAIPTQRLADAESALKTAMLAYDDKVRAAREEAERIAREDAERRHREERERAEAERLEAERRRIEAERAVIEAVDDAAADAALAELERVEQEQQRAHDAAYAAESRSLAFVEPAAPERAQASGIASRTTWKWKPEKSEDDALRMLVAAAARDPQYLAYLALSPKALNDAARSLKTHARIPGIIVYSERGLAAQSK